VGEEVVASESMSIMNTLYQYKTFIDNSYAELSSSKESLISKYLVENNKVPLENTFAVDKQLELLIKQRIKELAFCDINDSISGNEMFQEISVMVQDGEIFSSNVFKILVRQLQLEKRLRKEDLTIHINILENLWYHIGNALYFKWDGLLLKELFESAIDLYHISSCTYCAKLESDIADLIKAVKHFERFDISYEIFEGDIILQDDAHVQIHNRLEMKVKALGGKQTLKQLFFSELQPKYIKEMDRYLIHRNKSLIGETAGIRRVPYNYLINICGKFLDSRVVILTKSGEANLYSEITDESSKYLRILQLQGHSVYEDMFIEYRDLPKYIYKNIIFENLYVPIQYNPDFVLDSLLSIYKPLYDMNQSEKFAFSDYYKIAELILKDYGFCSTITFEELRIKLNMKRKILRNILDEISEDKENINKDYTEILSPTNIFNKPLVKLKEDTYFLISPNFCSYSFSKVMHLILKNNKFSNLNRKIGELTEEFAKKKLNEKNIPFKSGHYALMNQDDKGECDIVLETKNEIVFLEIKKRSLPDEFELGDDVEVLRSLGDGMLNAQKQILRHRIYLQKHNKMRLYQEENENSLHSELELKGRRIVAVSMCLPEYGFLTNKTISSQLLESLLFATYHATDPDKDVNLIKLNKLRETISKLVEELRPEDKKDARSVFFDTLFRSLQQFVYVLNRSNNVEQIVQYLTREIYLIDGSLDFYSSLYSYVKMMKN
jgi:hypothetical protein